MRSGKKESTKSKTSGDSRLLSTLLMQVENNKKSKLAIRDFERNLDKLKQRNSIISSKFQNSTFLEIVLVAAYENDYYDYLDATLNYIENNQLDINQACSRPVLVEVFNLHPWGCSLIEAFPPDKVFSEMIAKKESAKIVYKNDKAARKVAEEKIVIIFNKCIKFGVEKNPYGKWSLLYIAAFIGSKGIVAILLNAETQLTENKETMQEKFNIRLMSAMYALSLRYVLVAKTGIEKRNDSLEDLRNALFCIGRECFLDNLLDECMHKQAQVHAEHVKVKVDLLINKLQKTRFPILNEILALLLEKNKCLMIKGVPSPFKHLYALGNPFVNKLIANHLEQIPYLDSDLIYFVYGVVGLNKEGINDLLNNIRERYIISGSQHPPMLHHFIRGNYEMGAQFIDARLNWAVLKDPFGNTALHHLSWHWTRCLDESTKRKIEETYEKIYHAGGCTYQMNRYGQLAMDYLPAANGTTMPNIFTTCRNEVRQLQEIKLCMAKESMQPDEIEAFTRALANLENKEKLVSLKIIKDSNSLLGYAIYIACRNGFTVYLDGILEALKEAHVNVASSGFFFIQMVMGFIHRASNDWNKFTSNDEENALADRIFLVVLRLVEYQFPLNLSWYADWRGKTCANRLIVSPRLVMKFLDKKADSRFAPLPRQPRDEMSALHYLIFHIAREREFQQTSNKKDYLWENAKHSLDEDIMRHICCSSILYYKRHDTQKNEKQLSAMQSVEQQADWQDYYDLFGRFLQEGEKLVLEQMKENETAIVYLLALQDDKMNDMVITHLQDEKQTSAEYLFQVAGVVCDFTYVTVNRIFDVAEQRMVTPQQKSQLVMFKILRFDYVGALRSLEKNGDFPLPQCEENLVIALQSLLELLSEEQLLEEYYQQAIQLVKCLVAKSVNFFSCYDEFQNTPIRYMLEMEEDTVFPPLAIQYCREQNIACKDWGNFLDDLPDLPSLVVSELYQILNQKWEKTSDKKWLYQLLGFAILYQPDCVTSLLSQGVEINNVDLGFSFLYFACRKKNHAMQEVLLAAGADPNLFTLKCASPMTLAIFSQDIATLQRLASSKYYPLEVNKPIRGNLSNHGTCLVFPLTLASQYQYKEVQTWLIEHGATHSCLDTVVKNDQPPLIVNTMAMPQQEAVSPKKPIVKKLAHATLARFSRFTKKPEPVSPVGKPRLERSQSMRKLLREKNRCIALPAAEGNTLCQLLLQSRDETSFQAALKELGKIKLTTDSKQLSKAVEFFITFAIAQQKSATILWFCCYINKQMHEQRGEESEIAYTQDQFILLLNAAIRSLLAVDRELVRQLRAMLVDVQQAVRTVQLKKWQGATTPFLPNESRPQTGRKFLAESIGTLGAKLMFAETEARNKELRRKRRLSLPTLCPRFDLFPCVEKIKQAARFLGGDLVYDKDTSQFKEITGIPNCYLFIPNDFPRSTVCLSMQRFYERRAVFDEWHIKQLDGKGARTLCYKTQRGKFIVYEDRPITHELKIRGEERLLLCQIPGEAGSSLYVAVEYCENGLHTTHDEQRLSKSGKPAIDLTETVARYLAEGVQAKKAVAS